MYNSVFPSVRRLGRWSQNSLRDGQFMKRKTLICAINSKRGMCDACGGMGGGGHRETSGTLNFCMVLLEQHVASWLRYTTRKVGVPSPGAATIGSVAPLSRALKPTLLQGGLSPAQSNQL